MDNNFSDDLAKVPNGRVNFHDLQSAQTNVMSGDLHGALENAKAIADRDKLIPDARLRKEAYKHDIKVLGTDARLSPSELKAAGFPNATVDNTLREDWKKSPGREVYTNPNKPLEQSIVEANGTRRDILGDGDSYLELINVPGKGTLAEKLTASEVEELEKPPLPTLELEK